MKLRASAAARSAGRLPFVFLLLAVGLSTGCATSGGGKRGPRNENRGRFVLLNLAEGSGWVGYDCAETAVDATEEFRIVVIRQGTGEIAYDSVVALPSQLCLHGFELDAADPRLKRLSDQVEKQVVVPLEESKRLLEETSNAAPPPLAESSRASGRRRNSSTPSVPLAPDFLVVTHDGRELVISQREAGLLKTGDRLFLRMKPILVPMPGNDERIKISDGEVTGLVEVKSVNDLLCQAVLLSGEIPREASLEKAEAN